VGAIAGLRLREASVMVGAVRIEDVRPLLLILDRKEVGWRTKWTRILPVTFTLCLVLLYSTGFLETNTKLQALEVDSPRLQLSTYVCFSVS
jgi:hypothetical protein